MKFLKYFENKNSTSFKGIDYTTENSYIFTIKDIIDHYRENPLHHSGWTLAFLKKILLNKQVKLKSKGSLVFPYMTNSEKVTKIKLRFQGLFAFAEFFFNDSKNNSTNFGDDGVTIELCETDHLSVDDIFVLNSVKRKNREKRFGL